MCSTKALLAGDGDVVADIFRNRVVQRGKGAEVWGWGTAYGSKQAGQTVRRDTAAWNNEPLANGPKWTKGDRASWEEQIKKRQLAQHEHRRIYQ